MSGLVLHFPLNGSLKEETGVMTGWIRSITSLLVISMKTPPRLTR